MQGSSILVPQQMFVSTLAHSKKLGGRVGGTSPQTFIRPQHKIETRGVNKLKL